MKYLRTTWALPFLSAAYWGACELHSTTLADWRASVCGFSGSLILLIGLRQLIAFEKEMP